MFLAELNALDLAELGGWMAEGKLTSVIDRKYALTDVPAALGYLEQGHARGKVLIDLTAGVPERGDAALGEFRAGCKPPMTVRDLEASADSAERHTVTLAFACNFVLLGSYYILRPVRDTVATIVGVSKLQELFTATFIGTIVASALYSALASRVRLTRLLPGVFWFWLVNVVAFTLLFRAAPESRALAAAYYVWFKRRESFHGVGVLEPDGGCVLGGSGDALVREDRGRRGVGRDRRSARHARAGPKVLGLSGLMMLAAGGFGLVIVLVHLLMRQKERLRRGSNAPDPRGSIRRFRAAPSKASARLLKSKYFLSQAAFILFMDLGQTPWAYFCQTDLITRAYRGLGRTCAGAPLTSISSSPVHGGDPVARFSAGLCAASGSPRASC